MYFLFYIYNAVKFSPICNEYPYPTRAFQSKLAAEMGVTQCKIRNWFMNNRRLKKMKEESLHEDTPCLQEETGKIDYTITCIVILISFLTGEFI